MNLSEAAKILTVMEITYPNFHPYNRQQAVEIWHRMLSDYPYAAVDAALQVYIRSNTSGFAPCIGQLIAIMEDGNDDETITLERAWQMYRRAICNGYYNAEEEFNKLPEIVRKTIGSPDGIRALSRASVESLDSVEKSHFLRQFRAVLAREKQYSRVSQDVIDRLKSGAKTAQLTKGDMDNDFYLQGPSDTD